jgi:hypothetical protein
MKCRDRTEEKHYESQALYNFFHFFLLRKRSKPERARNVQWETENFEFLLQFFPFFLIAVELLSLFRFLICRVSSRFGTLFTLSCDENELIRFLLQLRERDLMKKPREEI